MKKNIWEQISTCWCKIINPEEQRKFNEIISKELDVHLEDISKVTIRKNGLFDMDWDDDDIE